MANHDDYDVRREVLDELWSRVASDTYPSANMLDRIECLMTPTEVPAYVEMLMERIRSDTYPSIDLLNRVVALTCVHGRTVTAG
jgi:hypothetical protein